jgi:hypothetical protein
LNCPAGGVRIEVTSNGVAQAPVYVCNGVAGTEDATIPDGGADGFAVEAGPNAIQQYATQYVSTRAPIDSFHTRSK